MSDSEPRSTTDVTLRQAIHWVASLSGFLGRKSDGEPGTQMLWLGIQRLDNISSMYRVFAAKKTGVFHKGGTRPVRIWVKIRWRGKRKAFNSFERRLILPSVGRVILAGFHPNVGGLYVHYCGGLNLYLFILEYIKIIVNSFMAWKSHRE